MLKIFALAISLFLFSSVSAQNKYPENYFRSPVDFEISLSGTFGELRSNHFHSGIDIRTGGVTGKKIHAVAEGYISRINVSGTGFGKAIYIKHPNGYTSVYGHLDRFSEVIDKYVKAQQYKRERFKVTLYPSKDQFVVKKGEVIARSGNSGGSGGPHLHFEIRDSGTEFPINPLHFGYKVKDFIRPKIIGLRLYPVGDESLIDGENEVYEAKVAGWGMNNHISKNDTIEVSGDIGFGIETYDLLNGSHNKNGVYSISLKIDSTIIYSHRLEKFSFSESKYINSLIEYDELIDNKRRFQRSIIDQGNNLSIYDEVIDDGIFSFMDSAYHQFQYEIKDLNGNASQIKGVLHSIPLLDSSQKEPKEYDHWFAYDQENSFKTDQIELSFKKGSFYKSFDFDYQLIDSPADSYSKLHQVHYKNVPVHKAFEIKILAEELPKSLQSKAMVVKLVEDDVEAVGGAFKDGFVTARSSSFGDFMIQVDTIAPEIKALNIHNGKKISGYKSLSFEIKDDFSGIEKIKATLNDRWILMDFDPKNDKLVYKIDDRIKKGKNQFRLEVKDAKNNLAVYKAEIEY